MKSTTGINGKIILLSNQFDAGFATQNPGM
jgi:hypothetical protein